MHLERVKEINLQVVDIAADKVEKSYQSKTWDGEAFDTLSQALDNLLDIEKMEKKQHSEHMSRSIVEKKRNAELETTEFEALIYKIYENNSTNECLLAIATIVADHMEDVRILNKRAYDIIMMKLRELS